MSGAGNPLLDRSFPIPFDRITPADVGPAVTDALGRARERIDDLGAASGGSGDDILGALDETTREVALTWGPVSHLSNVASTPELREAHADALPEITRFASRLHHHEGLFRRLREFSESRRGTPLTGLRRRHLDRTLRDFRRAGAELDADDKQALEQLRVELAELSRRFEDNLLDETAAFRK